MKHERFFGLHFDFHAGNDVEIGQNTNIEDIEKSEDLQEKAVVPVLDFSSEKKENVIINKEARLPQKVQETERNYLIKSQGKISGATGVIVRK